MQRSSESIGNLASALAKAQIELINPKKTMEATIVAEDGEADGRSFYYASLASGLDIVRKALGEHEIATIQTTALDQTADIVKLTTVLAHSSGEWIASEWPVCAISETAAPHRMGAALTYARRYALFTLVGIAGEDDLDAPDLPTPKVQPPATPKRSGNGGASEHRPSRPPSRMNGTRPKLAPVKSVALRDRLLGEVDEIKSGDDAALWAYCNLRAKDSLTLADAAQVEEAFQSKLAFFAERPTGEVALPHGASQLSPAVESATAAFVDPIARPGHATKDVPSKKRSGQIKAVDKSVLAFPEPRRLRDRDHVRHVAAQPCLICGRLPCDPHHLRFSQSRAMGRKVSDEFTVPLCRGHHREVHRCGDEAGWWSRLAIDPTVCARTLWLESHPLPFGPRLEKKEAVQPSRHKRTRKNGRAADSDDSARERKPTAGATSP